MSVERIIEDRLCRADIGGRTESKRVPPPVIDRLRAQVGAYVRTIAYEQGVPCADVPCPSPDDWRVAEPPLPEPTRLSLFSKRQEAERDLWTRVRGEFEDVRDVLAAPPVIPAQPTVAQAAG